MAPVSMLKLQYNHADISHIFPRQKLDQVLDFENNGVSKHLGQIADSMYEWEGPVAEQLDLTPADVAAIKVKSSCKRE